jgi:hypothetical protein
MTELADVAPGPRRIIDPPGKTPEQIQQEMDQMRRFSRRVGGLLMGDGLPCATKLEQVRGVLDHCKAKADEGGYDLAPTAYDDVADRLTAILGDAPAEPSPIQFPPFPRDPNSIRGKAYAEQMATEAVLAETRGAVAAEVAAIDRSRHCGTCGDQLCTECGVCPRCTGHVDGPDDL